MKILIICEGNIERSPILAYLLQKKFENDAELISRGIQDSELILLNSRKKVSHNNLFEYKNLLKPEEFKILNSHFKTLNIDKEMQEHKSKMLRKNDLNKTDVIISLGARAYEILKKIAPQFKYKLIKLPIEDPGESNSLKKHLRILKQLEAISKNFTI